MTVVTPKIWSPMDILTTDGSAEQDSVTMLPNGGYVVTWRENQKIAFQLYDGTGAKVGGKSFVQNSGTPQTFSDAVSYTADGGFAISWTEDQGANRILRVQKFNVNGTSNGLATITNSAASDDGAQIVANGDGGWAVAYAGLDGTTNVLRLTQFNANGEETSSVVVNGDASSRPDITWLGGTKYAVSYLANNGLDLRIVDGGTVRPADAANSIAGVGEGKVVALKGTNGQPSGQFVVVTNAGQDQPIIARTYTTNADGSIASGPSKEISPAQTDPLLPSGDLLSVTALRDGGYAVAFVTITNGWGEIWLKVVDATGQEGPAINVSAEERLQHTPSIFEMADGRLAVSWRNPSYPTWGEGSIATKIIDARAEKITVTGTSKNDIYAASEHTGDNFNGGDGFDTLTFQAAGGGVAVNLVAGSGSAGIAKDDTYTNFEKVIGSNFGDTLEGGAGHVLQGGAGDDVYIVRDGTTIVEGAGGGTDTIYSDANYTLSAFLENLFATGAGAITLTGNELNNLIVGNEAGNQLFGMGGNDTLRGGGGNDTLEGGDGDDVLIGDTGADVMNGGAGNDTYYIDDAGDQIVDGSGIDTVYLSTSYDISRLGSVENFVGIGSLGITLTGSAGNNVLTGNDGANILKGGAGRDVLNGGAGNDRIHGEDGNDTLTGGADKDIFVFDKRPNKASNVDKITDFNVRDDSIYVDNLYFKVGTGSLSKPKQMASKYFYKGAKAHDADDRIIYDQKKGILYYDKDGTGAAAAVKIATLDHKPGLTVKDFFVI